MCLSTSFMVLSHSTTMGLTATLLSRSWAVNNAMPYTLFPSMNNWSTATPSNEKPLSAIWNWYSLMDQRVNPNSDSMSSLNRGWASTTLSVNDLK